MEVSCIKPHKNILYVIFFFSKNKSEIEKYSIVYKKYFHLINITQTSQIFVENFEQEYMIIWLLGKTEGKGSGLISKTIDSDPNRRGN